MTESEENAIAEQARTWLVRLASGDMDEKEFARFRQWLQTTASHERIFARERMFWQQLEALAPAFAADTTATATPDPQPVGMESTPHPLQAFPALSRSRPTVRGWRRPRNRMSRLMLATLVLVLTMTIGLELPDWRIDLLADHTSPHTHIREVTLADGSRVTLDRYSAIRVSFTPERRRIELLRGTAFFEVHHNPDRPFEVHAGHSISLAVGTAFSVRRTGGQVEVRVSHGQVQVSGQQQERDSILLGAGEGVACDAGGHIEQSFSFDPQRDLAWRRGRIVFDQQPLATVLQRLDHYHAGHILLSPQVHADQPLSGVIDLDNLADGIQALATMQDLRVAHLTPWITLIY